MPAAGFEEVVAGFDEGVGFELDDGRALPPDDELAVAPLVAGGFDADEPSFGWPEGGAASDVVGATVVALITLVAPSFEVQALASGAAQRQPAMASSGVRERTSSRPSGFVRARRSQPRAQLMYSYHKGCMDPTPDAAGRRGDVLRAGPLLVLGD